MDALETGKRIQERRKQHCWTQKELAERICVSDKAVSKWERGLNFPDMALLKPLAEVLETSVTELLGLEEEEKKVELVTEVAAEETARLRKEIRQRAMCCIAAGAAWIVSAGVASVILHHQHIYHPWLQRLTMGMLPIASTLLANSFWLWWKHRK